MKLFSNKHIQRRATILLCIALLAVMAFSSLFIVLEHEHDCSGADCPICFLLHQAEENLTCLGLAEHSFCEWAVSPAQIIKEWILPCCQFTIPFTLVHLKVRQNK